MSDENELVHKTSLKKNGFPNHNPINAKKSQKEEKASQINGNRSDSSDVEIIDIEIPKVSAQQKQIVKPVVEKHVQQIPAQTSNLASSCKKPESNKLDNDVVYIIDDDKSDEEISAKIHPQKQQRPRGSLQTRDTTSHTEQLVNVLREKINMKMRRKTFNNLTNKPKAVEKTTTGNAEVKEPTRTPQAKKRVNPDQIISSASVDFQDSAFRVTRSSLSLPPAVSPKDSYVFQQSTSKSGDNLLSSAPEPMNKYSIENMFSGLVKICKKIFTDETLETKLWRTFKDASEVVLRSEEFINALKVALKTSEESKIESLDDKLMVSREIKEVMRIMKRHPDVVDKKVKKLTHRLNQIRARIRKLEEAEVTSDEEEENNYILLDRYRTRASKIYEKLCELQGISSDAGRIVRQKLHFSGNSGYPKIEKALEKFYHKTKTFPDFMDVKTLIEKTVKKENIDIPLHKIHNIAQTVFLEFGNKLKRMRCCDDYTILNDYLDEGKAKDPALDDEDLYKTLLKFDSTKKIREGEQKILNEYTCKEAEKKSKEDAKSEESDVSETSENEGVLENNVEKQDLHFSDTDDELMNDEVQNGKRKRTSSDEEEEERKKINHKSGKRKSVNVTEPNRPVISLSIENSISDEENMNNYSKSKQLES